MKQIIIDKTDFYELGQNIYCLNGWEINDKTTLYKYIDLSAFIDILNGNFKISLRKNFNDRHEKGELENPFCECLLPSDKKPNAEDLARFKKYREFRELAGEIPTSCFTTNDVELYAMWKSFTSSYTGVRITTTISDFIQSLLTQNENLLQKYELFIGPITYTKCNFGLAGMKFTSYLFNKNPCYYPEEEVRFYFIPKGLSIIDNQELKFKIDGERFIQELTLSPFIPVKMKSWMKNMLEKFYPQLTNRIKQSTIFQSI